MFTFLTASCLVFLSFLLLPMLAFAPTLFCSTPSMWKAFLKCLVCSCLSERSSEDELCFLAGRWSSAKVHCADGGVSNCRHLCPGPFPQKGVRQSLRWASRACSTLGSHFQSCLRSAWNPSPTPLCLSLPKGCTGRGEDSGTGQMASLYV